MSNNANLVNQSSGDVEYYTPPLWVGLARQLMGAIDLDPASNPIANQTVQAARYYTQVDDGLRHTWAGRVWMNHPFHRGEKACPAKRSQCKKKTCKPGKNRRGHHIDADIPGNAVWINKLVSDYRAGHITEAVIICFNSTSETWFWPLLDFPQFHPKGRVHYTKPDGSKADSCTKGSVITYLGPNASQFAAIFSAYGKVMFPAITIAPTTEAA